MAEEAGYVDYFAILGLEQRAKPGEVRKVYKRKMKALVDEIRSVEITEERRARYLLNMAQLNAALIILRDNEAREVYCTERQELIDIEQRYRDAADSDSEERDNLRREYDGRLKDFLSKYVEEAMLEAGHDKECVEASGWDAAHERHASRILRHYRHSLYREILERLPYTEVTRPNIDWDERSKAVAGLLKAGSR